MFAARAAEIFHPEEIMMTSKKTDLDSGVTCVGCDVRNCKFNDMTGSYCTANTIKVQNKTAVSKGETFCDTFTPKGSF